MSDRIEEFIIESREHLGAVEDSLLALEKLPNSSDRIERCLRSIHSIKGDAGFLGLQAIHEVAHAMESLLSQIRPPATLTEIETLLAARDRLAVLVDAARRSHRVDVSDILHRLNRELNSRELIPFEVDLATVSGTHSGGLASFINSSSDRGTILDGRISWEPCDLRVSLPTGQVKWTGHVWGGAFAEPRTQSEGVAESIPTDRVRVDLSAWSYKQPGLIGRLKAVADLAHNERGELSFLHRDLRRELPTGPVTWTIPCNLNSPLAELLKTFDLDSVSGTTVAPNLGRATDKLAAQEPQSPSARPEAIVTPPKAKPQPGIQAFERDKATTLRIQVELLDRMMTLVGELTLVRNQSLLAFGDEDGPQRAIIQRLNSVTTELQDVTLRARMQPVENLFNKFPRMVRDLARQLDKQVEIELVGGKVELDKTILEQLSDPLIHLLRNSLDHGLERPDERLANGKSSVGHITLSAAHEEGQVHIEIRDDGRGIDADAVKAKARSLGLKTGAELDRLPPPELFSLIFLPGFSTAKQVTEVSGRGVGLDVVKTNIEQLDGTLNIESVAGHGCAIKLRLPLTLAIIPCLVVGVGGEKYAIPQRNLEEVVALHSRSHERIEPAYNTEVFRLREKLLPIVRFSEVLNRRVPFTEEAKSEILASHTARELGSRVEHILVLRTSGRKIGLVVDEVRGTQEIVVKPMHPSMKRVRIFSGATIMGDGQVALIADVDGIADHARLSFESAPELPQKSVSIRDAAQAHRVLLFEYGPDEQFALPLIQIRRIEMVSAHGIEHVGEHEYVTIDGISTRILRLDQVLKVSTPQSDADTRLMSLILPKFLSQPLGILVSRIVDTESLAIDLQHHLEDQPGILGSAVVRDRMTLFLEIHRLSEKLIGNSSSAHNPGLTSPHRARRILLIDDTAFFREVVKRYLVAEGHHIVTAVHGEDGLKKLDLDPGFDLIVSDIEMPVMDGWEFAREVRRRGFSIPMLALTSLSGFEYERRAKACGYDSYEVKLDHDRLVSKVASLLALQEVSQ